MLFWPVVGSGAVFWIVDPMGSTTFSNPGSTLVWPAIPYLGYPPWYTGGTDAKGFRTPPAKEGKTFGMLMRPDVGADCYAYQKILDPETFRRSTVTFSAWLWSSVANVTRIGINDGVTPAYSSYHSGSSDWEKVTVSRLVDNSCGRLQAEFHLINDHSPATFIDVARLISTPRYNYGELTAYEIIEKLVNAIGGTLTYESRSSKITTFYPRVEVKTGQTAASILQGILDLVPDRIRWFGNDAIMYVPQTTDSPTYYYKGPE